MDTFESYRYRRIDMEQIGSVNFIPPTLYESIRYSREIPYSIVLQKFPLGTIARSHYSDTLEILVLEGVTGNVYVGNNVIYLKGEKRVIVIPPYVLHTTAFDPQKDGQVLNFKISFEYLNETIRTNDLLALEGHNIDDLMMCKPDYEVLKEEILKLVDADADLYQRTSRMVEVLGILARSIPVDTPKKVDVYQKDDHLNSLVSWVEKHYAEKITIDQAAERMHLSRYYFCKYFKKMTGVTFVHYLSQVRIYHAIMMLLSGKSASECAVECGFENLSYFIQQFKHHTGCSTREYLKLHQVKSEKKTISE